MHECEGGRGGPSISCKQLQLLKGNKNHHLGILTAFRNCYFQAVHVDEHGLPLTSGQLVPDYTSCSRKVIDVAQKLAESEPKISHC